MLCRIYFLIIAALFVSLTTTTARADIFSVTGGTYTCAPGDSCPAATTLDMNQSTGPTPISFELTATSGDTYHVSGSEFASYSDANGTDFEVKLAVSYTGASPAVANDTFTIDVLQNFYDNRCCNWNGTYTETSGGITVPGGTPQATYTVDALYDGQSVGILGPFAAGDPSQGDSKYLSGLTDDTLAADERVSFTFPEGTQGVNALGGSATPEPRETLPLVILGLGGMAWARSRRRLSDGDIVGARGAR